MIFRVVKWSFTSASDISRRQVIFHVGKWYCTPSSRLGFTREIRDIFHFYAIHFLWERKSAMVLIYIYMYIRIAFSIELRLRVSRSLRSLANNSRVFGRKKKHWKWISSEPCASSFLKLSLLLQRKKSYTLPTRFTTSSRCYIGEVTAMDNYKQR